MLGTSNREGLMFLRLSRPGSIMLLKKSFHIGVISISLCICLSPSVLQ